MAQEFDIIKYISGLLAGFVFDKATLERIALDRGVMGVTSYEELDAKTKELLKADLAYSAYYSPSVWASSTQSHGSYSKSRGSQTVADHDKERLYNIFSSVYKKYDDPVLEQVEAEESNLQWMQ